MEEINKRIEEINNLLASRKEELKLAEKAKATDSTIVWRRDLVNSIRDLEEELVNLEAKLAEQIKAEEEARKAAEEARRNEASKTAYFHDQKSDEYFGLTPEDIKRGEQIQKEEAEKRAEEARKAEEAKKAEEEAKKAAEEEERKRAEEEARRNEASKTAYFHDQKSDEYFGLEDDDKEAEETSDSVKSEINNAESEINSVSTDEKERIAFVVQQIKVLFLNMNITTDELLIALKEIVKQAEKRKADLAKEDVKNEENVVEDEIEDIEVVDLDKEEKKLTDEQIQQKIFEIDEKQRLLADKILNKIFDEKEEKAKEENLRLLDQKYLKAAEAHAIKEFDSYKAIEKFKLRFKENREEVGPIRSFFRSFRKDEEIDAKICKDIQKELLESKKDEIQTEKNRIIESVHQKIASEFNNNRDNFRTYGLAERQAWLEGDMINKFPEYREEILSLSEELKKYEKEIAEFENKKNEETRGEKDSEKTPKDERASEEQDELEV